MPAPADPLTAQVVACIAATVRAIEARLRAKGPMYAPDAEWTRLMACAGALRAAGRELREDGRQQVNVQPNCPKCGTPLRLAVMTGKYYCLKPCDWVQADGKQRTNPAASGTKKGATK
jgi:hypothetical protein